MIADIRLPHLVAKCLQHPRFLCVKIVGTVYVVGLLQLSVEVTGREGQVIFHYSRCCSNSSNTELQDECISSLLASALQSGRGCAALMNQSQPEKE